MNSASGTIRGAAGRVRRLPRNQRDHQHDRQPDRDQSGQPPFRRAVGHGSRPVAPGVRVGTVPAPTPDSVAPDGAEQQQPDDRTADHVPEQVFLHRPAQVVRQLVRVAVGLDVGRQHVGVERAVARGERAGVQRQAHRDADRLAEHRTVGGAHAAQHAAEIELVDRVAGTQLDGGLRRRRSRGAPGVRCRSPIRRRRRRARARTPAGCESCGSRLGAQDRQPGLDRRAHDGVVAGAGLEPGPPGDAVAAGLPAGDETHTPPFTVSTSERTTLASTRLRTVGGRSRGRVSTDRYRRPVDQQGSSTTSASMIDDDAVAPDRLVDVLPADQPRSVRRPGHQTPYRDATTTSPSSVSAQLSTRSSGSSRATTAAGGRSRRVNSATVSRRSPARAGRGGSSPARSTRRTGGRARRAARSG